MPASASLGRASSCERGKAKPLCGALQLHKLEILIHYHVQIYIGSAVSAVIEIEQWMPVCQAEDRGDEPKRALTLELLDRPYHGQPGSL